MVRRAAARLKPAAAPRKIRVAGGRPGDHGRRDVEDAEDGAQALKLLRSGHFDLVIADWEMPNMAGIDLLKAIRADHALQSLPVVLVTAERSKDQVIEAARAGVDGYVVKPFSPATLKTKLEQVL